MTPIVLVHGLFGHQRDPRLLAAFGERPVFAPSLLGYGAYRDAPVAGLILADQVQHLRVFLDGLGVEKVHLVGHSVGGAVAALAAIAMPGRLASLTSVEGNFTLRDAFWSRSIAAKPVKRSKRSSTAIVPIPSPGSRARGSHPRRGPTGSPGTGSTISRP
ncbi:alpha/beta fold hydrolase [Thioclava sp. BHET1]|nr:alpha/beta fold hydrolase [Thioclava sp. BHET1]